MARHFNIADMMEILADDVPENIALTTGHRRLTHAELDKAANRFANFLKSQGVGKGDHLGLHMYNDIEYMVALVGALKLRAVPINLNYRYVADELVYMIDNADLVAIVSHGLYAHLVDEAEAGVGQTKLKTRIVVPDGRELDWADHWIDWNEALAGASDERTFEERSDDDLFIIYTGGTTGMPKGVMWRHRDLFFAGLQGGAPSGDPVETPEEVGTNAKEGWYAQSMLPCAPYIHGSAQLTSLICLLAGGKVVIQNGKSFDIKRVVDLVELEGANTLSIVGDAMAYPLIEELKSRGDSFDPDSIIVIASAGAILSAANRDALQELLPDTMIINAFGSTESGHAGTVADDEESMDGRPSFYMDETCSVVTEEGEFVKPGSGVIGKFCRTGAIPLGYYKDEEKTNERFKVIDGKRWVVPGDFATIEEDGRVTFLGRGSKCINTGGEKVFPEEVEEALKAHEKVIDALVVGVPNPRWGQMVAAVVSTVDGAELSLEEVQAHARSHVAGYKVPRLVVVKEKVERFTTGKPDYKWAEAVAKEADAAQAGA